MAQEHLLKYVTGSQGGTVHFLDLKILLCWSPSWWKFGFTLVQRAKCKHVLLRYQALVWAPYKRSSPLWQQIFTPGVEDSGIHSAVNDDCTGLVHFKALDKCGWKWIIKLIRQPEFARNKQAECVASRCASGLQYGHVFRLVWVWLRVWTGPSQCIHLVFSPSRSQCPSSSQHRHGISRHAGELKGKCPVKQHDDGAEHPFKDGRCMLQDKALLAEKHTAWNPG